MEASNTRHLNANFWRNFAKVYLTRAHRDISMDMLLIICRYRLKFCLVSKNYFISNYCKEY